MKARISGMWRSLVAVLMALVMVVGLVPTTAFATEEHSVEDVKAATACPVIVSENLKNMA